MVFVAYCKNSRGLKASPKGSSWQPARWHRIKFGSLWQRVKDVKSEHVTNGVADGDAMEGLDSVAASVIRCRRGHRGC